jgi:F0F1-type ATP synthase assembly protein I
MLCRIGGDDGTFERIRPCWLLIAKVVCCGALVLAATGAISFAGFVSWLVGGGPIWLAAAVLVLFATYLWRRRPRMNDTSVRKASVSAPLSR